MLEMCIVLFEVVNCSACHAWLAGVCCSWTTASRLPCKGPKCLSCKPPRVHDSRVMSGDPRAFMTLNQV